jgi:hypothetical protein
MKTGTQDFIEVNWWREEELVLPIGETAANKLRRNKQADGTITAQADRTNLPLHLPTMHLDAASSTQPSSSTITTEPIALHPPQPAP